MAPLVTLQELLPRRRPLSVASPLVAVKLSLLVVILVGVDLLESYSSLFTRGVHARYSNWRNRR